MLAPIPLVDLSGLPICLLECCMDLSANLARTHHDESPRLHEADGRRAVSGGQNARQQILRQRFRQKAAANVAPRSDGTIDGFTF